jgi:hypothetical protein
MAMAVTPIAAVVIIAGPDTQCAINRTNARAYGATDHGTNWTRCAITSMGSLFRAADQALRLRHNWQRQKRAESAGKNKTRFHHLLLDGRIPTATLPSRFGSALSVIYL